MPSFKPAPRRLRTAGSLVMSRSLYLFQMNQINHLFTKRAQRRGAGNPPHPITPICAMAVPITHEPLPGPTFSSGTSVMPRDAQAVGIHFLFVSDCVLSHSLSPTGLFYSVLSLDKCRFGKGHLRLSLCLFSPCLK